MLELLSIHPANKMPFFREMMRYAIRIPRLLEVAALLAATPINFGMLCILEFAVLFVALVVAFAVILHR